MCLHFNLYSFQTRKAVFSSKPVLTNVAVVLVGRDSLLAVLSVDVIAVCVCLLVYVFV